MHPRRSAGTHQRRPAQNAYMPIHRRARDCRRVVGPPCRQPSRALERDLPDQYRAFSTDPPTSSGQSRPWMVSRTVPYTGSKNSPPSPRDRRVRSGFSPSAAIMPFGSRSVVAPVSTTASSTCDRRSQVVRGAKKGDIGGRRKGTWQLYGSVFVDRPRGRWHDSGLRLVAVFIIQCVRPIRPASRRRKA